MSFRKIHLPVRVSHRARLTAVTAAFAGLLLSVLFVAAVYGYSYTELKAAESELRTAVLEASAEYKQNKFEPDLHEIVRANAELSLAIFDTHGYQVVQLGNIRVPRYSANGTTEISGVPVVVMITPFKTCTVAAAVGWLSRQNAITRFAMSLAFLWPGLVLMVASITWFASRSTFEPLERLARQAEALSTANLHARLEGETGEYAEFAQRLNRFLARLEQSVRREERFVSDAAHELRTPLTVMKGRLETTLLTHRTNENYEETLKEVLSETERLAGLVEVLLQSATLVQGEVQSLDILEQIERAHARWVDRFTEHEIELNLDGSECFAKVKPREFEAIIDNLLSNALKSSPPHTHCRLEAKEEGGGARIDVADEGVGVPADKAESIFERLTRLDEGRSRDKGGFGIGLSVCRRIVEGRGGTVRLESGDNGAHFVVMLPN